MYTDQPPRNKKVIQEPYSSTMQLLDHQVTLRDETNPYGEVSFASIIVHALTLPAVLYEQLFTEMEEMEYVRDYGYATLDDELPNHSTSRPTGTSNREQETRAPRRIERKFISISNHESDPRFCSLSMLSTFASDRIAFKNDHDAFIDEQHIAMIVYVDEEYKGIGHVGAAQGLLLRLITGSSTSDTARYERVGIFTIGDFPQNTLGDWSWQTLTLV